MIEVGPHHKNEQDDEEEEPASSATTEIHYLEAVRDRNLNLDSAKNI